MSSAFSSTDISSSDEDYIPKNINTLRDPKKGIIKKISNSTKKSSSIIKLSSSTLKSSTPSTSDFLEDSENETMNHDSKKIDQKPLINNSLINKDEKNEIEKSDITTDTDITLDSEADIINSTKPKVYDENSEKFLKILQKDSSSDSDVDVDALINEKDEDANFGLKVLSELERKSASISAEINLKLQLNMKDPEIETLRELRRGIWDQMEQIENHMQIYGLDSGHNIISVHDNLTSNDIKMLDDENQAVELYPEERTSLVDNEILKKISEINRNIFKNQRFRGCQAPAIEAALKRKDVFVLMPTGGGKSLVYQLAGYIENKLTVIISPLISLIKDQVRGLKKVGLNAIAILGETTPNEYYACLSDIEKHKALFLFITPEKLASSSHLLNFLLKLNEDQEITRFVVDEAHCVSQWGHDFRPSYTQLDIIKERFDDIPVMALTATATSAVKEDIIKELNIPNCLVFQMSFNRPNLIYEVWEKYPQKQSYEQVLSFIKDHHFEDKCGLIFCMSTNETEELSDWLNLQGLNTRYYHAQMKDIKERHNVQRLWTKDKVKIIVATLAFGMGIDKPDVRFVIHHTMPKSIEEYYQESGRAGRDGILSICLMLFSLNDKQRVKNLLSMDNDKGVKKDEKRVEVEMQLLDMIANYCLDKCTCRRTLMLNYFGQDFDPKQCNETCDNCIHRISGLSEYVKEDVTEQAFNLAMIVKSINDKRPDKSPYATANYVISIFEGRNVQKIRENGDNEIPEFGRGSYFRNRESDLFRIFAALSDRQILKSKAKLSKHGSISYYVPGSSFDEMDKPNFQPIQIEKEVPRVPDGMNEYEVLLYKKLLRVRRNIAVEKKCDPMMIISIGLIKKMVAAKPKTILEMEKIPDMPKRKVDFYGDIFVHAIIKMEKSESALFNKYYAQNQKTKNQQNKNIQNNQNNMQNLNPIINQFFAQNILPYINQNLNLNTNFAQNQNQNLNQNTNFAQNQNFNQNQNQNTNFVQNQNFNQNQNLTQNQNFNQNQNLTLNQNFNQNQNLTLNQNQNQNQNVNNLNPGIMATLMNLITESVQKVVKASTGKKKKK